MSKLNKYLYPSGLLPAAPVLHGYKNVWIRDMYYAGICSNETFKKEIWTSLINLLDKWKWKLEIHAKKPPGYWYEFIHVRYSPDGEEIRDEHWMHNQWDAIGNWLEITIDMNRLDLEVKPTQKKRISFSYFPQRLYRSSTFLISEIATCSRFSITIQSLRLP